MWVLVLNDMRSSQIKVMNPMCRATTREELSAFVERETVEPYREERWLKQFRKGGPLEWYNPPSDLLEESFAYVGDREEWAEWARHAWDNQVAGLPLVSTGAETGAVLGGEG